MARANTITLPEDYDPRDISGLLELFPTDGIDVWPESKSAPVVIGPTLKLERYEVGSGGLIQFSEVPYALVLPTESFELFTGGFLEITEELIDPDSYELLTGAFVDDIVFVGLDEITYTQSSLYFANTAASAETMIDGEIGGSATGTNFDSLAWVKMDLGAEYLVDRIIIGTATSTMPGGWDKSYTENASIEFSTNDLEWTTAADTQTFNAEGIFVFNVFFAARYIRLARQSGYIAVTEFYALAPQQLLFNAEA
jgi:hypothetical protein